MLTGHITTPDFADGTRGLREKNHHRERERANANTSVVESDNAEGLMSFDPRRKKCTYT